METYVALLHSIVLGGGRRVVMADLKAVAEGLGYQEPRTLAATGNLVFRAPEQPLPKLEAELESAFAAAFGRHVDIIMRTAEEWLSLARGNPFLAESEKDPASVHVRVMRAPLEAGTAERLLGYCTRGERVAIVHGDLWVDFGGKPSESRLLGVMTTKRLGIGTVRNWNTVKGLRGMVAG
ncbi:DUF1697 domain-containing protein [Mesorhizobium plurifarium]|uniref:DUF1697 domain-containing protein n=1 Tax=Sinorhizobium arboris TaxID=76745 RepID=UPI00047F6F0A|nr:DUF1697 domain-containing protein [Sinorhizobium arboris]PST24579.1 DUF1697 domain-containing protein [Mesorhizobium plurifarium]